MADGDFEDVRDGEELGQVVQVQVVAGVHPKAETLREFSGAPEFFKAFGLLAFLKGPGVRLRIQFDSVRLDLTRKANLFFDWI